MGRMFGQDSFFTRLLTRAFDLIVLNLLTMLLCLPVVTIGPALTAHAYVLLHMVRDEDNYIVRMFFKSFRENLRQSIILEVIAAAVGYLIWLELRATGIMQLAGSGAEGIIAAGSSFRMIFLLIAVYLTASCMYLFILPARFDNTIPGFLRTAVLAPIGFPARTAAAMVVALAAAVLYGYYNVMILPILILFGLSLPGYLVMNILDPVIARMDGTWQKPEETAEETETEPVDSEPGIDGPAIPTSSDNQEEKE